jgi:signal transduction histidine kinase
LEQARRQLLANLVHEIGRPLGALRSAISALMSGAERDRELYNDLLKGMDGEMQQLQRLLNDLSGLQDHVLGTLELDRQPVNLNTWLPDCLLGWQAAALEKGIQWEFNLAENLPTISGDPNRLTQVLGNLASNAIKFTPPGGIIEISTQAANGQVGITVRDTGPGMSLEEQEQIFQPFFRGAHGQRFPQGMGLGLSIARDLTEAHGGHLAVESTPGEGSRFTAWLPAEAPYGLRLP